MNKKFKINLILETDILQENKIKNFLLEQWEYTPAFDLGDRLLDITVEELK